MAAPWGKIRAEWLKGGTTYKALGEKYGLSGNTIRNRASKEGWAKEKVQIRDKVGTELRGRIVRARVNHLEKLIDANEALLDGLVKLAELIRADPEKLLIDKTFSLKSAESFAKALQVATMTQRDLYRLPTIDQKFAAKKWKDQLKLEKEKQPGGGSEGTVWNILEPEGEDTDA